jgi:hypothetical protein
LEHDCCLFVCPIESFYFIQKDYYCLFSPSLPLPLMAIFSGLMSYTHFEFSFQFSFAFLCFIFVILIFLDQ